MLKKLSLVGLLAAALFVGSTANAATADELQAQITALLAQIAQLQGGASSSTGCYAFTRDLTDGVSGADVSALQSYLAAKGMFSVAPTGYFGAITKASVASWQSANGVMPAAGYFGAISRAKYAAVCEPVVASDDDTSGDDDTSNGDLEGGAGSVDTYTLVTSLNNEEVGEDTEDVEVAGLEIEVDDGSDIALSAVRLVFTESTGVTGNFDDYATEVSLWLDGEEVGRADANDFSEDNTANTWTKTVSLDDGAIIRAGDTSELVVAVSGIGNLDSTDSGDTWTVDFRQVRFEDADGSLISEDPSTGVRNFTVESFATASNLELKASLEDASINDAHVINVHATDDTQDVELLSFNLEAEGDSDVLINSIPVLYTVTGAGNVDDMITDVTLFADGEEIGSENMTATAGATETITFDDLDYTINAGDTIEFVVKATFISIADALDAGDTISAQISATEMGNVDAEDESGENLTNSAPDDLTGTAVGDAHEVRDVGIMVSFVSASEAVAVDDGADDDTGTFQIVFEVEAFDGTVYVSDTSAATTAATIVGATVADSLYLVEESGTATVSLLSDGLTYTTAGGASESAGGLIELGDGDSTNITLTVTRTNDSGPDGDGLYRTLLKALGWNTDDTGTFTNYNFNLEDFKTDLVSLN